jgi:hypothetical protein
MAIELGNSAPRRRNPIKRNSMFLSDEDFNLEMEFAEEYLEHDANQCIVLYEVDMSKTKVDDVYKEAKKNEIRFKPPIEVPVVYTIDRAELKTYNTQQMTGYYVKTGKLTFGVLEKTLERYGCEIHRGDYVGIQVNPEKMVFWTVTNDGKVDSYANANTLYGTRPVMREVVCAIVDSNEMNG